MAQRVLNAQQVADDIWTDIATAIFAQPRKSISVSLAANGAAMYQLGFIQPPTVNTQAVTWEADEHHLVPGIYTFNDPAGEGLPPDAQFAGIRFRSITVSQAAVVTVA